jgi:DNA-binding GntR family transcriptional regulator
MANASALPAPASQGLRRMIAAQLRQLIYGGEFKAGDRLNEAALAVRMGTSRGPIREAIRILAGTGLVTPVVNRGVFVRQVSLREILEIYDLRALVFGFAAEAAARHITDDYVKELHLYRRQNFNNPGNMVGSNAEHRLLYVLLRVFRPPPPFLGTRLCHNSSSVE